jgi:hypothetical protein
MVSSFVFCFLFFVTWSLYFFNQETVSRDTARDSPWTWVLLHCPISYQDTSSLLKNFDAVGIQCIVQHASAIWNKSCLCCWKVDTQNCYCKGETLILYVFPWQRLCGTEWGRIIVIGIWWEMIMVCLKVGALAYTWGD